MSIELELQAEKVTPLDLSEYFFVASGTAVRETVAKKEGITRLQLRIHNARGCTDRYFLLTVTCCREWSTGLRV